jgi:hypothetical protein
MGADHRGRGEKKMKNEPIDPKTVASAEAQASPAIAAKQKSTANKKAAAQPAVRPGTKKAAILTLLHRPKGATLKELMKATTWQAHSVRGFLSGTLGKNMGLKLKVMDRDGERAYHVKG